jgi:hypothetical protein
MEKMRKLQKKLDENIIGNLEVDGKIFYSWGFNNAVSTAEVILMNGG